MKYDDKMGTRTVDEDHTQMKVSPLAKPKMNKESNKSWDKLTKYTKDMRTVKQAHFRHQQTLFVQVMNRKKREELSRMKAKERINREWVRYRSVVEA